MQTKKEWKVFDALDTISVSEEFSTMGADVLYLQIDGTFSAISVKVLGRINEKAPFIEDTTTTITQKGIYNFIISPYSNFKIEIDEFTGTSTTIYARIGA